MTAAAISTPDECFATDLWSPLAEPVRVLLVEDEPEVARLTARRLERSPHAYFEVSHASDLDTALRWIEERGGAWDALLLDLALPDSEPRGTLAGACALARHFPIVVLTGHDDDALARCALGGGARDYLLKQRDGASAIAGAILLALERHRRERQLRH